MSRASAFHHRINQPALKLEPVVSFLAQVRDRVFAKKIWTDMFFRRFAGQRFHAVLAKLEQMSIFIRTRPGAALAIETIFFVNFHPIAQATRKSGFTRRKFQTLKQRVHSGRDSIRCAQFRPNFFIRRLGPG